MAGHSGTIMVMNTPEAARLRLQQYLSPAFPTGSFAWSQGLEWAIDQEKVTRETFPQWLRDWLAYGSCWTDAVLLSLALKADADYAELDDLARAACMTSQRLTETVEQGTAFATNVTALTGNTINPSALPVIFGQACIGFLLAPSEIIAAFLQAQAAALVSAVVRFMPLGPLEGQVMLAKLQPTILEIAARAENAGKAELTSLTWGADIAAMSHETMTVRIFRS